MIRLHILVEGQTEEAFVKGVLAPDLARHDVFADAHRITTGRHHGTVFRGGFVSYDHLARDLVLWMRQDQQPESWFTTMVDFYRLPADFPQGDQAQMQRKPSQKVMLLEAALAKDIARRLADLPVSRRFIPYIQLHEFETLLFSAPACFADAFPERETLVRDLIAVRAQFPTPEDIDNGPDTAPSKRILNVAPDYQKPVAGALIARRIGLEMMCNECRHFGDWIARLRAPSPPL